MFKTILHLVCSVMVALMVLPASAHDFKKDDLLVDHPWSRPTPPNASTGVVYLKIENKGNRPDRLLSASTELATKTGLHETVEEDGIMKMKSITGGLALAPGTHVSFEPGGLHLMLVGLKTQLEKGAKFPLTLVFEEAGPMDVIVHIEKPKASAEEASASGHEGHAH